jgi:hypothetical protein
MGLGAISAGLRANSNAIGGIAIGYLTDTDGSNATAIGTGSVANGIDVIAVGNSAQASGVDAIALGSDAVAQGNQVTAVGAGSSATFAGSTAVGAGATTTRTNQVVIGTSSDEVTLPGLSGSGTALVAANDDGTLKRSSVSMGQMETAVKTTIPKLESAARGLGRAVESSGAIAAAMSAIPEVTLQEDEPMRCGVGTGGFGSQYAVSAGCAVRVGDRLHLNGALSYSPSIDYDYGSTPSVAGRLGFSFPLGRIAKATAKDEVAQAEGSPAFQAYLSEMEGNIDALQSDVELRDGQIDALKAKLDALLNGEGNNQQEGSSMTSEATTQLIAMLKEQIKQLEEEKKASDAEDDKQNALIEDLQAENQSLRKNMQAIMRKLGIK